MAVYAGPEVVTNGLVLALDAGNTQSYPGSGTAWTDLSGNGNNGTLTNGPTFNSNNRGSIVFDGVNDYASLPTPSGTFYATSMSVWIKRNGNQANWAAVFFDRLTAGTSNYAGILFRGDNGATGPNQIIFAWNNLRIAGGQSDLVLADNTWYMITMSVYSDWYAKFFVHGPSGVVSREVSTYIAPYTFTGLQIAKESSYTDRHFKGNMGIAMMYNRALSDAEITQNFNALRGRFGI